jgi:hypothetical protein
MSPLRGISDRGETYCQNGQAAVRAISMWAQRERYL